jgi:hypothetical protein
VSNSERFRQALIIARLEARRAFFSKRAFWVYLLALFPTVIFVGHGIEVKFRKARYDRIGISAPAVLDRIEKGDTAEQVLAGAAEPVRDFRWRRRRGRDEDAPERRHVLLWDGDRQANITFEDGVVVTKNTTRLLSLEEDRQVYAAVFQFFYLRLAIFFGCLGIFMNLFRGEMLDKTLHFWLLAPVRREVLLGGKYLAGLLASTIIFCAGAALCYIAMLWPQEALAAREFWNTYGWWHLLRYVAAAALGCLGYGSIFVAAGLLVRNPIIPAAVILFWEGVNSFLPAMLQRASVQHYVQALVPVPPPFESDVPALVRMLFSPAEPPSPAAAVLGLLALTALVLWLAARAVRRLEINYGTE